MQATLAANRDVTPAGLQAALRRVYPRATVRPSQLSDDPGSIYVYRDGRLELESVDAWWDAPDVAWARVSATTGIVIEVTGNWEENLGAPGAAFVGRHFSELVHPDARDVAEALFQALLEHSDVRSTIIVQRADGTNLQVRFRAIRVADEILVYYVPA